MSHPSRDVSVGGVAERETSLRERTRRAVRAEIADAAMELFLDAGFEATTVEEIAHAAGVSRRSYFRYFASKEDALAAGLVSIGQAIVDALTKRPVDEPAWQALRRAFDVLLERADTDPNAASLGRLMLERPSVQRGKEAAWQEEIAHALEPRLAGNSDDSQLRAEALAAAAISCLHTAQTYWLGADDGPPLSALLDGAMDAVHPLTPP